MASSRKEIPVALLPEIKRAYENASMPVEKLARHAGLSPRTFLYRVRELGWTRNGIAQGGGREPPGTQALAMRIRSNVERELSAFERLREMQGGGDIAKFDLAARMLTGLLRSLQEAMRLEQTPPRQEAAEADDVPRDIEELRRALLDRVEKLAAAEAECMASESDQG